MINNFYIGTYWSSRPQNLAQVSDKVLQTLERLSGIDQQFINWYELGLTRKKALEKNVPLNLETIQKICLKEVKKGELSNDGFSEMGFTFGLWTGHNNDESSGLTFSVGASFKSKYLVNSIVLNIPFEGEARNRLIDKSKILSIISMFIEIWDIDYAVLSSSELNNQIEVDVINQIGWITYRKSIKRTPKLNPHVIHEKINNGHLFYLDNAQPYDSTSIEKLLSIKPAI